MDPFLTPAMGTIIGAGISGLGSFFGGRSQQQASAKMAREQMDFQERMSSTAHQREVQDLRAAGLNPILSTRLGGSSTPSGAMGTAVNYIGDAARTGVSTALAATMQEKQLELMNAQIAKTQAEKLNVESDTQNKITSNPNIQEQWNLTKAQSERTRQEVLNLANTNANIRAQLTQIQAQTSLTRQQTATEVMNTGKARTQWNIFNENLTSAKSDAEKAQLVIDFLRTDAGRAAAWAGLFGKELSNTTDALKLVR